VTAGTSRGRDEREQRQPTSSDTPAATFDPRVVGSIPAGPTTLTCTFATLQAVGLGSRPHDVLNPLQRV